MRRSASTETRRPTVDRKAMASTVCLCLRRVCSNRRRCTLHTPISLPLAAANRRQPLAKARHRMPLRERPKSRDFSTPGQDNRPSSFFEGTSQILTDPVAVPVANRRPSAETAMAVMGPLLTLSTAVRAPRVVSRSTTRRPIESARSRPSGATASRRVRPSRWGTGYVLTTLPVCNSRVFSAPGPANTTCRPSDKGANF